MEQIFWIKVVVGGLALVTILYFFAHIRYGAEMLSAKERLRTIISSFLANFFDTFGVGSFSSYFALRSLFGLMPDTKRYNGSLVIQATLPTALQSILFLALVKIDSITLITACIAIALGGIVSGYFVKFVSRGAIFNVMLITFVITAIVLIMNKLNLLDIGGNLEQVRGTKLAILAVVMFLSGCLPAFGVGYYSIVLVVIFLLGLSPAIAYPIMTTASAVQMPMTAIPMIKTRQFYSQSALIMALVGCVAVMIAAPIISNIDTSVLKWILLVVLAYNIWTLIKAKRELAKN